MELLTFSWIHSFLLNIWFVWCHVKELWALTTQIGEVKMSSLCSSLPLILSCCSELKQLCFFSLTRWLQAAGGGAGNERRRRTEPTQRVMTVCSAGSDYYSKRSGLPPLGRLPVTSNGKRKRKKGCRVENYFIITFIHLTHFSTINRINYQVLLEIGTVQYFPYISVQK